jgi:hypothetical protein
VVSLIKLGNLAVVVPGIALWSFGVLILLLTAIGASFDAREFWMRAEAIGVAPLAYAREPRDGRDARGGRAANGPPVRGLDPAR